MFVYKEGWHYIYDLLLFNRNIYINSINSVDSPYLIDIEEKYLFFLLSTSLKFCFMHSRSIDHKQWKKECLNCSWIA